MPINNITQTISVIPAPPHRGVDVQTVFVTKQEDFQDHLQGTTVTELNTLKGQLNTRIGEINSTATTMNGYASTASAGASTATTKAGEASASASEALTSKNHASTFASNSSYYATKASQWANNNYNAEVETGKYSAKHWSTVAQNATSGKMDKVTSTDNAVVRFDGVTGAVQNSSVIIDDSGNVGINNNAPLQKLHVGGSIIASDATYASTSSFIGAILNNNSTTPSLDIRRWNGNGTNHGVIKIAGNSLGEILFYRDVKSTNTEATTEKMKLDVNDNLLVGTSVANGLDKVQIEGTFSSKAVKHFYGIDLNTLKTRTEVCSVASTCTNLPITETGFLEVFMLDSNSQWVMQRFTAIGFPNASNQGRTYVRNWMTNSTWSDWVEK